MKFLTALLALVLASCATQAPQKAPPYVRQSVPEKSADARPALSQVQQDAAAVSAQAERNSVRVDTISRETKTLRGQLDAAVKEAERMRALPTVPREDFDRHVTALMAAQQRNMFLEDEATAAQEDLKTERALRQTQVQNLQKLDADLSRVQEEASQLRLQIKDADNVGESYAQLAARNGADAAHWKAEADKRAGTISLLKKICWLLGGALFFCVGVFVIRMAMKTRII